jgi:hypothetical protein
MHSILTIDTERHPEHLFRVDSFRVPAASRAELEAAMARNLAFLETLPGFLGHVVLDKCGGPTTFDVVTVAAWESAGALEKARSAVVAYYQEIGFDMPARLAAWGVSAELGSFRARAAPQS